MELHIPPIPVGIRNAKGQWRKGAKKTPPNKGKKWSEYNVPEASRKIILANLSSEGREKARLVRKKLNSKQVIGVKDRKFFGQFDSASDAARKLSPLGIKLSATNIRTCCKGKRPCAGGVKWFYESDFEMWNAEIKKVV